MEQTRRIDPDNCGCTDCLTGYSVPLSQATIDQVTGMLAGRLINATGQTFTIEVVTTITADDTGQTWKARFNG